MSKIWALTILIFTIACYVVLNTKFGNVPPLGKFLDPFGGFWQNAEANNPSAGSKVFESLKAEVEIVFDEHRIPHIFAANEHDLYFAQGYITASDRLWQLDFQTRFAAGRLSEVVGPKAVELDKYQRRMGMVYGAENFVKELDKHRKIKAMTEAYAEGINAYIETLSPEDYPIEFKILDYKPEKWSTLNTALLLKLMSATLAGSSDEFYMSNALKKFGPEVMKDLFPDFPFKNDPVIPAGTKFQGNSQTSESSAVPGRTWFRTRQREEGIGSNNWAVSAQRSATGYPILANDPHLNLTLPAIWYQTQLVAPGINVYGVSIPGAPGIVIGFNQKVAWGVTNVGSDVLDWYKITFRSAEKKEYLFEGRYRPVYKRIESIAVRGGKTVADTVLYSHHGPIVYTDKPNFSKAGNVPEGYALRWVAHDPSVDIATFYYLNRASNYNDYRKALSLYTAPAQNFAFASIDNDIAITSNGYFPLKPKGHGKFLLDGSKEAGDWNGRIPFEHNPSVKNPSRGFVSSANQNPTDNSFPYFLNWEFAGYERGHRINTRLSMMQKATADSMRNLQNDNFSVHASTVLPTMLKLINTDGLSATEQEALNIVSRWNYRFDADEIAASIFEIWQKKAYDLIWDEFNDPKAPMRYPNRDRTVHMVLNEPNSKWFDIVSTPEKESREDILLSTLKLSVDSLQRQFGVIGKNWRWANVKNTQIPHLSRIPGFGSGLVMNGGSKSAVNALNESNGPSWRMVVTLGKPTRGYGIFPGGQSGNPGSRYYDDQIGIWAEGRLSPLVFMYSLKDNIKQTTGRLKLSKKN